MLGIIIAICVGGAAGLSLFAMLGASKQSTLLTPQRFQELRLLLTDEASLRQQLPRNKIQAIKIFREETGVGLREAKEAVEYMIDELAHSNNDLDAGNDNLSSAQVVVTDDINAEIVSMLQHENKITVIKYYRQRMHVGLKEAKHAVDYLAQNTLSIPLDRSQTNTNQKVDAEKLQVLIRQKKKIEAIRYYREATGVGLKEAKEAVEWLEEDLSQRGTV